MASLGVHVKWETGESRWVGQSDAGNTVAFLMVIRLQNHEVLFSYIYLPLCVSGVKSVIIFGFYVKSLIN